MLLQKGGSYQERSSRGGWCTQKTFTEGRSRCWSPPGTIPSSSRQDQTRNPQHCRIVLTQPGGITEREEPLRSTEQPQSQLSNGFQVQNLHQISPAHRQSRSGRHKHRLCPGAALLACPWTQLLMIPIQGSTPGISGAEEGALREQMGTNSQSRAKRSGELPGHSRAEVQHRSRSDHAGSVVSPWSQQMLPNAFGNTGGYGCFIELSSAGKQDAS